VWKIRKGLQPFDEANVFLIVWVIRDHEDRIEWQETYRFILPGTASFQIMFPSSLILRNKREEKSSDNN
jgi:hypothetical protein